MNLPAHLTSRYQPALVDLLDVKYAVVDGVWYDVPSSFTFDDLKKVVHTEPIRSSINDSKERWFKVLSSNKKSFYVVKMKSNTRFSCDCPGFGYRRNCSHIDQVRKKLNKT